jgi:hypothetical protein
VAIALALPAPIRAQDADAPPQVLSISQWICPNSALGDISDDYEEYTLPVERDLVAEGMLTSAGLFFHAWADEWNVGYYRVGSGVDAILDAVAEVGRRLNERNPELADQPGPFAECSAHKDNFYFMGPSTMAGQAPTNGG